MDELGNTQYKETRYRSPNSTKQSTELRNIERPNSYYLRKENRIDSQFPDASLRSPVNMHAEGRSETPQYKMKPCLECHCASSNKNHEAALAFATPTRSKPSPKTNSVRLSRSGTIIGTPRPHHSNKYHSKRSESPKNDVANTRHSHIDEYIPSKKTQSSASPKHRRGGSFELRPPTPNLERQSGVDSRDRNPSPRSRRTSELNELGVRCCYCHRNSPKLQPEKRCCYCHRNSPKLQPEIFTNPYESPKKVKHHRNHSSPRRTSYDANASFMTPPAFNSTPYDYSLPPPPPPQWSPVLRNCPENFYEFNNSLPCKHQSLPFDSVPYCPGKLNGLARSLCIRLSFLLKY